MSQHQNIRRPQPGEIPYLAGEYLYRNGPRSDVELFRAVDFGSTMSARLDALQRAICGDWLMETERGKIACSRAATDYYDEQSDRPKEEYVGQIAPAPQRNVFASPGLSKKNIPNRHGLRPASDRAPAWSVREKVSIKTITGNQS
jgi:hypothetical protein